MGTAIGAELKAESRGLREALAEFSEGIPLPEADNQRYWDFGSPFVAFDGGIDALSSATRERLNDHEAEISDGQRQKGIADLRGRRIVADQAAKQVRHSS